MKTNHLVPAMLAAGLVLTQGVSGQTAPKGFVAHEWGTFTSLQGSDGVPLKWSTLRSSALPRFVYDWSRAGLGRQAVNPLFAGVFAKGEIMCLQRMETPVIYFYSDRERRVDVTVRFPQGLITEWYPQAAKLGPSSAPPLASVKRLDGWLHKIGVTPSFTTASIFGDNSVKENLIGWPGVRVLPSTAGADAAGLLPQDPAGTHYVAARETDAALLKVVTTNQSAPEYEKFLFYRGVANFVAPLKVSMPKDEAVAISNTGKESLAHLFVLKLQQGRGTMVYLESLPAGAGTNVNLTGTVPEVPQEQLTQMIKEQMTAALTREGLYPREASAMVRTWTDSWFTESGTRVLYVLPREWTDRALPMQLSPAPDELVRVMVGRAEVLSPRVERTLASETSNPATAAALASTGTFKELGRFAPAALEHVRAKPVFE